MNKRYPPFAFVASIAVQWWLWSRITHIIKDDPHRDSWYFCNIGLAGVALLFLAPVLRHGLAWQRVVAVLLCVVPVAVIAGGFYYSYTVLTER
ncbi:MAG TPA: hypothetical protein PKM73_11740 [Verrucomicrobiota bacterium]|nr:hypothetical protein [Verrucomicrobiota bacterium]